MILLPDRRRRFLLAAFRPSRASCNQTRRARSVHSHNVVARLWQPDDDAPPRARVATSPRYFSPATTARGGAFAKICNKASLRETFPRMPARVGDYSLAGLRMY